MGVSSSESHDLTAFYEMLSASFGVLSKNTGFSPSLDRIIETTLGPLNLGPGGGSYNDPSSCLHRPSPWPSREWRQRDVWWRSSCPPASDVCPWMAMLFSFPADVAHDVSR